jgi:hypothetical protein
MLYTQVVGILYSYGVITEKFHTDRLIHQIYNSSAPYNAYGNSGNINRQKELISRIIEAEYMGCIGIAIILNYIDKKYGRIPKNRVTTVTLTLIGVGAFNFPIDLCIPIVAKVINYYSYHKLRIIMNISVDNFIKLQRFVNIGEPLFIEDVKIPSEKEDKIVDLIRNVSKGIDYNKINVNASDEKIYIGEKNIYIRDSNLYIGINEKDKFILYKPRGYQLKMFKFLSSSTKSKLYYVDEDENVDTYMEKYYINLGNDKKKYYYTYTNSRGEINYFIYPSFISNMEIIDNKDNTYSLKVGKEIIKKW